MKRQAMWIWSPHPTITASRDRNLKKMPDLELRVWKLLLPHGAAFCDALVLELDCLSHLEYPTQPVIPIILHPLKTFGGPSLQHDPYLRAKIWLLSVTDLYL